MSSQLGKFWKLPGRWRSFSGLWTFTVMEAMVTPGNVKGKGDPMFNMVRYLGKERWITGSWEKHGILAHLAKLPQWVTLGSNCFRISLLARMLLGKKKGKKKMKSFFSFGHLVQVPWGQELCLFTLAPHLRHSRHWASEWNKYMYRFWDTWLGWLQLPNCRRNEKSEWRMIL